MFAKLSGLSPFEQVFRLLQGTKPLPPAGDILNPAGLPSAPSDAVFVRTAPRTIQLVSKDGSHWEPQPTLYSLQLDVVVQIGEWKKKDGFKTLQAPVGA